MKSGITVQLRSRRWKKVIRPYCKVAQAACDAALRSSKLARYRCSWQITVVLADNAFIRELNRDYLGHDHPTNVLAFPSEDYLEDNIKELVGKKRHFPLGDIVLALETVEKEAKEQNKDISDHVTHLLVHGVLHLLGYDHIDDAEADKMEGMEIKILKKLGIRNPYLSP